MWRNCQEFCFKGLKPVGFSKQTLFVTTIWLLEQKILKFPCGFLVSHSPKCLFLFLNCQRLKIKRGIQIKPHTQRRPGSSRCWASVPPGISFCVFKRRAPRRLKTDGLSHQNFSVLPETSRNTDGFLHSLYIFSFSGVWSRRRRRTPSSCGAGPENTLKGLDAIHI